MSQPETMRAGNATSLAVDRLSDTTAVDASTMPLTSSAAIGRLRSSRASNQSEYTFFPPSDCPTNQDHLRDPP